MKQAVMISIHPKWCELIADGKKTIEVRKTRPKINTPFKCYIYETKGKTEYPTFIDEEGHEIYEGRGQIIGEFTCDRFYKCRYDSNGLYETYTRIFYNDGENYLSGTCLTYEDLIKYSSEDDVLYGWNIKDLVIYEKPKELNEFGLTRSPQSWFYVKETEE